MEDQLALGVDSDHLPAGSAIEAFRARPDGAIADVALPSTLSVTASRIS
jgi:hypothetical protein